MTKWNKIILVLMGIAMVAVLCAGSYFFGFREGIRAGGLTSSMAELMLINQHMIDQMANASCQGVKQSINDHLGAIEKYKNAKEGLITETTYHADKMLGHIQLAQIEEYEGNSAKAKQHMVIAKEACAHRNWTDCSEERMVAFVKRLEEKNPISCLGNKK